MYNNIIFDFGQVLVHFIPENMTLAYIKNPDDIKTVSEVVFDRLYWDRLDIGNISDEEIICGIKERLPERLHNEAIKVYNNWIYNLPFIDGMVEIVSELKHKGFNLFLLSNISINFAERYHLVNEINSLFSMFNGIVLSGPIGLVKPNKEIFEHLLNSYSLNADECLFIDDNKNNILGAQNVGINGYLFDGNSDKLYEFLFKSHTKE